jgi:hypothetical protein
MIETSVKMLRLVTGEDIISESTLIDDKEYLLAHPLKVVYNNSTRNPGYVSVLLVKWVFGSITEKDEITIKERDVLFSVEVSDRMFDYYYSTLDSFKEKESEILMEDVDDDDANVTIEDMLDYLKTDKGKLH